MQRVIWIICGIILISLSAQLSINLNFNEAEIPVTGQTLAVIVVSMISRRSTGFISILMYLILGGLGLPVFADGNSGIEVLLGKTSGYLISFLLIPIIFASNSKFTWRKTFGSCFFGQLLATGLILFIGALVLSTFIGIPAAIKFGIRPFIIGGLIKILLGTLLVWGLTQLNFSEDSTIA